GCLLPRQPLLLFVLSRAAGGHHMSHLKHGHAPGHIRETTNAAFEAWLDWDGNEPEPTVEHEISYKARRIPISQALRLLRNCTDIVPGELFCRVQDAARSADRVIKLRTYAACARALLEDIKSRARAA